jgi:hypothetical protein
MSLRKILPIPDKWKVKDAIVYKVYERGDEDILYSPIWATTNQYFIGKSYRDHAEYPIFASGTNNSDKYESGWHSFINMKGVENFFKYIVDALDDRRENYAIVKVKMRHPVAYGIDESGSRVIVYKYKTLVEEVPHDN